MIKLTISIFILVLTCFTFEIKAQDFLEVKFSINDITKQKDNFKNGKIKSVSVSDKNNEKIFEIDNEGKIISESTKGDYPVIILYKYDNNNLIGFVSIAHETFIYDKNGNVSSSNDDDAEYKYFYDSINRLIKQEVESNYESCPFEKIIYEDDLMIEKKYPCCEGNYAFRYVYEYLNSGKLHKVFQYSKNCSSGIEEIVDEEEYFYYEDSNLPYKMKSWREGQNVSEINFEYEYYE